MSDQITAPTETAEKQHALPRISKVFVTGGTGLVGSNLIKELISQGKSVTAIHRGTIPSHLLHDSVQWIKGDILDIIALEEAMPGMDEVYHCAAIVSFNPARRTEMFKINVEGTANVVNAAINCGVKKLLFVSSVAALGRIRKDQVIDEMMHWTKETSNSDYGKSKYLAEMEVWRGMGEGLEAVIINPVIILGAADWNKGSAGMFKSAYNEFPWYTEGSGGFVDVNDVVKAMVLLMDSEVSDQRFIISAENQTYHRVFSLMAKAFGKKPAYKKVTPFLANVIWRMEAVKGFFSGSDPLLTKETANTALTKVAFDNTRMLSQLPQFTYTPLEETIDRVCKEIKDLQHLN
ncbi:MAG: NAD-dependent epimerase/dehydratase family protein [Chitinophagaceae bacterium]|nr:NAD-dependent epimerase/dehydratase family protein [Chitinophagaceae bacterium]